MPRNIGDDFWVVHIQWRNSIYDLLLLPPLRIVPATGKMMLGRRQDIMEIYASAQAQDETFEIVEEPRPVTDKDFQEAADLLGVKVENLRVWLVS